MNTLRSDQHLSLGRRRRTKKRTGEPSRRGHTKTRDFPVIVCGSEREHVERLTNEDPARVRDLFLQLLRRAFCRSDRLTDLVGLWETEGP